MTKPIRPTPPEEDSRTAEILESVKETFAAKGFDGASMQDLARGAGMSAGNFYRYFQSKNAIIEAMIEREMDHVTAKFAAVIEAPDPLEALREMVLWKLSHGDQCEGTIWAEIELMAARRPEIAELFDRMEARVIENLVAVFGHIAGLPAPEAMRRFGAHARLAIFLVQGPSSRAPAQSAGQAREADQAFAALVGQNIEWILSQVVASKQDHQGISEIRVHVAT